MFNINRLSVGQRLACGFGTLLLLGLAIAALGAWGLAQTNASLQSIYMQRTVPLKALASMRYLATRDRVLLMDALLHAKADVVTKRVQQYRDNRTASAAAWKLFAVERLDPAERKLADEMARTLAALVDTGFEPMAAALAAGNFDAAKAALEQKVSPLNPAFIDAMDRLMGWQVKESAQTFDSSQSLAQNVTIAMAVLGALGLVAGVAGAVLITRSLVRALGAEPDALAAVAERIADGDLADSGAATARPGSVMASMQNMRQALVRVVGSVRSGVDGVATASAQIADGNQDLSTRTEQQASSLQQTASSMEQLTGTIGTSAENARQASVLAQGASEVAARGGSLVTQVVQTMGEIQAASRKIGDIIGVIDSIAFQTNILALNAAVEAARAGEQGRGFAVVASEVRSLAQRSAEAARQIKSLIGDSVQRVDSGGVLVQSAGQTMDEIVAQVRRVSDLIGEITSAAAEQSLGINQVGEAVSQLDRTTQQNAALVEQSAAAADSLKMQAARLAQAVAVFRLAPAGA